MIAKPVIATSWDQLYEPPKELSVVSWSGGIESTTLVAWLRSHDVPVHGFHVEYGQKSLDGERASVQYWSEKLGADLTIFECRMDELAWSTICSKFKGEPVPVNRENVVSDNVLEGRNLTFLSLATMFATGINAEHIYIGYNEEPFDRPYPDSTIESWKVFQALVDVSIRVPLTIHAPFAGMRRIDILRNARLIDDEIGIKTFSCFEGADQHCGVCEHCTKQVKMMAELGVDWP